MNTLNIGNRVQLDHQWCVSFKNINEPAIGTITKVSESSLTGSYQWVNREHKWVGAKMYWLKFDHPHKHVADAWSDITGFWVKPSQVKEAK